MEEFFKSRELRLLTESGGSTAAKRKKKIADKNDHIEEASVLLEKNKITITEFLNRMVFEKGGICVDLEPIDDIFDIDVYQSASDDDDDETVFNEEAQAALEHHELLCIICQERPPNTVLMPCKHLKCCNICVLTLQNQKVESQLMKCPYCRQECVQTIQVFV